MTEHRPVLPREVALATFTAGLVTTVLAGVGGLLLVDLPGTDAPGSALADYSADNRTRILLATVIWGCAATALGAFAAGVRYASHIRSANLMNDIGLVSALALVAIQLIGWGLLLPLAFREQPADTARLLGDLVFLMLGFAGVPAALWTVAASHGLARASLIRHWVVVLGYFSAASHLQAAAALASDGPFSPSGPGAYIAPVFVSVWIAVVTAALAASLWKWPGLLAPARGLLVPRRLRSEDPDARTRQ